MRQKCFKAHLANKKMNKLFLFLFLFPLLQCNQNRSENQAVSSSPRVNAAYDKGSYMETMEEEASFSEQPDVADQHREVKLLKNGYLQFEVERLNESKREIDEWVDHFKAYYEDESYRSFGNRNSYSLLIRVPSEQFDSLIVEMESNLGKLLSKNVHVKDVTEEYVDLKIRLDNHLAYLDQYQQLLKKANSIKDILEIQEKIRRIEEEIESKKGRIQYLDNRAEFSSLSVEISEFTSHSVSSSPSYWKRVRRAFENGIRGFLSFTIGLINLWPFVLGLVLLIVFRKRIVRSWRNR